MRATRLVVIVVAAWVPGPPLRVRGLFERIRSRRGPLYRPKLVVPEALQPHLDQVAPGHDAFPEEREASELAAILQRLGEGLRRTPATPPTGPTPSSRPVPGGPPGDRRAGSLRPSFARDIPRARGAPPALARRPLFARELRDLVRDMREVTAAEFLITSIDLERDEGLARTSVRYDIVGPARTLARRAIGGVAPQMAARPHRVRVLEWTASEQVRSRARAPLFTEVTTAALGGNDSFRRQLRRASMRGWPRSTPGSPAIPTATTASRSGTPTGTAARMSTWPSRRACRTDSTGLGVMGRSRT